MTAVLSETITFFLPHTVPFKWFAKENYYQMLQIHTYDIYGNNCFDEWTILEIT
jgi:hypothetical protein